MNGQDILQKTLRKGWLTSEFWLAIVAIVIPFTDRAVESAGTALDEKGIAGAIIAGAVAGAYAVGRSIVKGKATEALLKPAEPPVDSSGI